MFPLFEIVYEVRATCVVQVEAMSADDAERMVRMNEAGDVVADTVGIERVIAGVHEVPMGSGFLTNCDPGDES